MIFEQARPPRLSESDGGQAKGARHRVMGAIFSLPLTFSGLMAPESPEYSKSVMFISTIVLGMAYGLLVEIITSLIFKARMQS